MTQLPRDGTVHELTSNVLIFLEQLLEYIDTIGNVLAQDLNYSIQLDKMKTTDKKRTLLGLYISKTFYLTINTSLFFMCNFRKSVNPVKPHTVK